LSDEPSRDEALLWLNDRLGKRVAIWIGINRGHLELDVFEVAGELRHWTEGQAAGRAANRDSVAGLYEVGDDASLDLSDVRPLEVSMPLHDHLTVRLDENTTLNVVEQNTA
jgi:hypothetical protein